MLKLTKKKSDLSQFSAQPINFLQTLQISHHEESQKLITKILKEKLKEKLLESSEQSRLILLNQYEKNKYFQTIYIKILIMDHNVDAQSYIKFSKSLQKMQLKKKGDRGFIIVGPSKNGKTCIFCSICGIKVKKVLDKQLQLYFLQPQKQKNLVSQDPVSTTQHPNVRTYTQMGKTTQIIDMPGHSDDQSLRKLCNFFYIREMALKLERFNFLIVLNIYDQQDYTIDANNISMLKNFTEMFKHAQQYVNICINKSPTEDANAILRALKIQLKNQLAQETYKYYSYALQNQKICLIPDASLIQKDYMQVPQYIMQLIQSQNYKPRAIDEFGKLKFDATQTQDLRTQQKCKDYCMAAYQAVQKLIKVVFKLASAFMMFFIEKKKVAYQQIILKQGLDFDVVLDNQYELQDIKSHIQYNLPELSPTKKKSSVVVNQPDTQKNFAYLDILLSQFQEPFKKINTSIDEQRNNEQDQHMKANIHYEALINQFIEAIRQTAQRSRSFKLLEQSKNVSLDSYLNSLSLLNIRKWKQINFLQEAVDNKNLMLFTLVINAQDAVKHEMPKIIQPVCRILKLYKQMFAKLTPQNDEKNASIHKSIIEKIMQYGEMCNRVDQIFFKKNVGIIFEEFIKFFKAKESYCNLNLILKAPEITKDQTLEKLRNAIQVFKNLRGDKKDVQCLNKSQAELILLIAQLFQKISLYSLAITFYQVLGHNLKIKRCLNQIIAMNPNKNFDFFIGWGHYFSQQCDFQTAYELYEKAKERTFDGNQLYNATQFIVQINNPQKRTTFAKELQKKNVQNGKKIIVCAKLNSILNEGRKQLQKIMKNKDGKLSNKEQKFRNYLAISNIKQQLAKIRNENY